MEKIDEIALYAGKKYLIFEDNVNRKWYVYDSSTKLWLEPYDSQGARLYLNYGDACIDIFNIYTSSSSNSPKYDDLLRINSKDDITALAFREVSGLISEFPENFEQLRQILIDRDSIDIDNRDSIWRKFCFLSCPELVSVTFGHLYTQEQYPEYCSELGHDWLNDEWHMHNTVFNENCFVPLGYIMMDGVSCRCYESDDWMGLFYHDFRHYLFDARRKEKLAICQHCGELFVTTANNYKYCPECAKKAAAAANKKKNPVRYQHKKICDFFNQAMARKKNPIPHYEYTTFKELSNYHWEKVKAGTESEDEYVAWLQQQKDKYKNWTPPEKRSTRRS